MSYSCQCNPRLPFHLPGRNRRIGFIRFPVYSILRRTRRSAHTGPTCPQGHCRDCPPTNHPVAEAAYSRNMQTPTGVGLWPCGLEQARLRLGLPGSGAPLPSPSSPSPSSCPSIISPHRHPPHFRPHGTPSISTLTTAGPATFTPPHTRRVPCGGAALPCRIARRVCVIVSPAGQAEPQPRCRGNESFFTLLLRKSFPTACSARFAAAQRPASRMPWSPTLAKCQ